MKSLIRMLGVLCFVASAANASTTLAAVFPVRARGIDSNSVRIIEEALANALLKTGKLRLVERSQMEAVLREQGFQGSGACDGSECAVEVGRILGVQQGVISSLGRLGGTWVLNARLVDIETGEILISTQRSVAGAIDFAMTELVPKVATDLTSTNSGNNSATGGTGPGEPGQVSEGSSGWMWWTLGGIVVAGGAAAAALVLSDNGSPSSAQNMDPMAESTVPVQVTLP